MRQLFTVLIRKNGTRCVVVTLPEHESWLTDILTTWPFYDTSRQIDLGLASPRDV